MIRTRSMRMILVVGLLAMGQFFMGNTGCGGPIDGGAGGVGTPSSLSGSFKSDKTEKTIVFSASDYSVYFTAKQLTDKQATLESGYTVVGNEISFNQADSDEPFAQKGTLNETKTSFTWEKYPGETFSKQ